MKKIIYSIIIAFIGLSGYKSYGQVSRIPYYDHISFNGSFAVIAESDEKSDYYVVDLSRLGSQFEKDMFITAAFSEAKIVRIDAGNSNMAWYKADKIYPRMEITLVFSTLKDEAALRAATMSEAEKNEWLNRNGK